MQTSKLFKCVLALAVCFLVLSGIAPQAEAQQVAAAIVGKVQDPSGAPIANATVTAKDVDRGTILTAQTK